MPTLLNQSTSVTLKPGPFISTTDGYTVNTTHSITYTDVILSKAGGAGAAKHNTTASAHDTKGLYFTYLDGNDVGTLGELRLDCQLSGALPLWDKYVVVPANIYNALVAGSDYLQTDVANWNNAAVSDLSATTIGTASNAPSAAAITTAVLEGDWSSYEAAAKNTTSSKVGHALAGVRSMALGRLAISGTALTVYEADGTTVLATFTLASDYSTRSAPS